MTTEQDTKQSTAAPWIRLRSSLSDDERRDMQEDKGMLLPLDQETVFDLVTWEASPERWANGYPMPSGREGRLFHENVASHGVRVPVELDKVTLNVVDGHRRLTALLKARKTGNATPFAGFRLVSFACEAERLDYQDTRAAQTRRISRTFRQEMTDRALQRHPDWADGRLGALVGADPKTVAARSRILEAAGEIVRPSLRLGSDNRWIETVKPQEPARSVQPEPRGLGRLMPHWWDKRGCYTTTGPQVLQMVAELDTTLAAAEVFEELHKLSTEGKSIQGYIVSAMEVAPGVQCYQLIRERDRRIAIENCTFDGHAQAKAEAHPVYTTPELPESLHLRELPTEPITPFPAGVLDTMPGEDIATRDQRRKASSLLHWADKNRAMLQEIEQEEWGPGCLIALEMEQQLARIDLHEAEAKRQLNLAVALPIDPVSGLSARPQKVA